ncbi:hypothetical protein CDD83_10542 [Cordyceps sp. RAO-2017]|nr:hypothetical protein CDD83_10542 [Cordyceps sp. RAO-2017]
MPRCVHLPRPRPLARSGTTPRHCQPGPSSGAPPPPPGASREQVTGDLIIDAHAIASERPLPRRQGEACRGSLASSSGGSPAGPGPVVTDSGRGVAAAVAQRVSLSRNDRVDNPARRRPHLPFASAGP